MMIGNLPTSPLQGEYAPLYKNDQTQSLNVAEALSRLRYWTGEPSTEDRPWAKPVIKLSGG